MYLVKFVEALNVYDGNDAGLSGLLALVAHNLIYRYTDRYHVVFSTKKI